MSIISPILRRVLCGLLLIILVGVTNVPAAAAAPGKVGTRLSTAALTIATYEYGSAPEQNLDVYYDTSESGRPWIIVLHGGSWASGNKLNIETTAKKFEAAGFVVFNVEYRKTTDYGSTQGVEWAQQRDDVLKAIAWVRSYAPDFGASASRGAIYGFSAGGQLAAAAGLYGNGSSRVKAVVSASGVLQPDRVQAVAWSNPDVGVGGDKPTDSNKTLAAWAAVAVRCPYLGAAWAGGTCDTRWQAFRPVNSISDDDPPMWLSQGTIDPSVPPATGPSFLHYLNTRNPGGNKLFTCTGWGHNECIMDGGVRQAETIAWLKQRTAVA